MADELTHYGVKGMKWGVNRAAKRDAVEFSKAKMYYGEGAGNRRKLIKATVESRSKSDPAYKQAFDQHLASQNMAKRAAQAKGQRHRTDAVNTTAKTARGVKNVLLGNAAYASTAAVVLVGGYSLAKKTGVDKKVMEAAKATYSSAKTSVRAMQIKQQFKQAGW